MRNWNKVLTAMPCRGDGLNYEAQTVQDEEEIGWVMLL